jgi:long-chain acyl-CoA synthetase
MYTLLEEAVRNYGDVAALHQPVGGGKYKSYTWGQFRDAAREVACGLRSLGVGRDDIIGIGSETRAEFYFADLGVMACGATSAALYVNATPVEQVEALRRIRPKIVMVENRKATETLHQAGGKDLETRWVLLTGVEEGVMTLEELRGRGRAALHDDADYFDRIQLDLDPARRAILYLTSGATGAPKFVEVSQDALTSNVDIGAQAIDLGPQDRTLAFLPSAHIAQRVGIELLSIRLGIPTWFTEGLAKMASEFKTVRPTFFLAPPRVWEKVHAGVRTEINKRGGAAKKLFITAVGMSADAVRLEQAGKPVPMWMKAPLALFDKLVFQKVRDRFGGELRFAVSGAAPLAKDLALFFEAIRMPLHEGFGLTEGGIVTVNLMGERRIGSIGKALPGVKLKLGPDGELLIKSPTLCMGYFEDPAATAELIEDGWLHTGDIAQIDPEGWVSITGRKKEIIVSSNGKKIYPSLVEEHFKTEPLISQMVLAGDQESYISALFTLNPAVADGLEGLKGKSMAEMAGSEPVRLALRRAVHAANRKLAPHEQIKRFHVLPEDFTIEGGELTPTMKVRRSKVIAKYAEEIKAMYASKEALL